MPSTPLLRPMTEADLTATRYLWAETDGVELAEGDSLNELAGYLRRNPGMSFVASSGGQLVGAVLAGHDGRRGLLYHLAVSREQRGERPGAKTGGPIGCGPQGCGNHTGTDSGLPRQCTRGTVLD